MCDLEDPEREAFLAEKERARAASPRGAVAPTRFGPDAPAEVLALA